MIKGEPGERPFVVRSTHDFFPSKLRKDSFDQEELPETESNLLLREAVGRQNVTTIEGSV
jgi:hypothetical protein